MDLSKLVTYKTINWFLFLLSAYLLIYIGFRSSSLSFTHDESFTFNHYVSLSVADIISYHIEPVIANNHILNTLCMKFFSSLFGNSEFVLRFHSFLAHVLYLCMTYLVLKSTNSRFILFFGFIILNVNPYLLDFFSLARGYALSISLMMASLYCLISYTQNAKLKSLIFSLSLSLLAVLANFSMISYALSLFVFIELYFMFNKLPKKNFIVNNAYILVYLIVVFWIYFGPIAVLQNHHELNFGGSKGLWADTVISCIISYLSGNPYFETFIYFYRFLVVFVSFGALIVLYKKYKSNTFNPINYITIVFILMLLASVAQHLLLNGNYFTERFALFLVPLFFFALISVIQFGIKTPSGYLKYFFYAFSFFVLALTTHVAYNGYNTNKCTSWTYDADTKTMLNDVGIFKQKNPQVKLGITWLFEPTINFYKNTNKLSWLNEANRDGLNGEYDYYYVERNDINTFNKEGKILIKTYLASGSELYKQIH